MSEVFLAGKFGSKLEAATQTMQQLDAHVQQLNATITAQARALEAMNHILDNIVLELRARK